MNTNSNIYDDGKSNTTTKTTKNPSSNITSENPSNIIGDDNNSNRNNYVDFNQFILQHNFATPTYGNGGGVGDIAAAGIMNNAGGSIGDGGAGVIDDIFNFHQQQQQQQISPSSALNNFYGLYSSSGQVPYNTIPNNYYGYPFENSLSNELPTIFESSLIPSSSSSQQQQQQNEILPTTSASETSTKMLLSTSNLIPTAEEFVPRFKNLKNSSQSFGFGSLDDFIRYELSIIEDQLKREKQQQQQQQQKEQNENEMINQIMELPKNSSELPQSFGSLKDAMRYEVSTIIDQLQRQEQQQQQQQQQKEQTNENEMINQIMKLPNNSTKNIKNNNNKGTGTINKVMMSTPSTSHSHNSHSYSRRQRNFDENRLNAGGSGGGGVGVGVVGKYYQQNQQNNHQSTSNYSGNGGNGGISNVSNNNKNLQKATIETKPQWKRRGESWYHPREPECYRNDKCSGGGGGAFSGDTSDSDPDDLQSQKSSRKQYQYNLLSTKAQDTATAAAAAAAANEKLSQREKLMNEIDNRKLECLVCVEQIKVHQSVWSCNNCYHILHLNCIIKWATSSMSDEGWRCPACQNITKTIPRNYYCFCGKTHNPQYNRNDLAHSCGEQCSRKDNCTHPCTLQCHPGPCPQCQANVNRECGCGKTKKTMQCYMKEDILCGNVCGKRLNCEIHTCEKVCHQGKCPNCEHKVDQKCHCGKLKRQIACTRESNEKKTFSCGKPCSKMLACDNHKCKEICHLGNCKPCKLTPEVITSCPCGKMPILKHQRKSCLDPIPVCTGTCGKTLKCGPPAFPHHCISKCHLGNCPPCNKQTAIKCRCGHMDQMIKCRQLSTRADDARCKKRCTKKRSCGKHKCNQECCIDIDHICPLPCSYNLSCGKHKCDQPCHRGNCPPCYRSSFDELHCECGANVIYPPVPCGTKRPVCDKPCSRQHSCDHPVKHNCHSASTCPPCMIFTTKWCFGHHEQRKTIPCSWNSFGCGLPCNKDLPCGRHKCIKSCHDGQCQTDGEICIQNCTKIRVFCGHKCNAPCHNGDCPETPCKEMIEVTCQCGNRKQLRTCQDVSSDYRRIVTSQLASTMQEMQRGNFIELSDIMAPLKMTNNKALECNEDCRQIERNRRLAIGLQIRNPELTPSSKILTKYSEFVRGWAKKDPQLVKTIHDTLTNLVKLSKESKQKSRSHSFPTMNRDKRQLVHEMCGMFGVDSVAYDAEPNRNVVATAHKERSWLPAMSVLEVLQRENGQRRIPVPNNNAWGIKK